MIVFIVLLSLAIVLWLMSRRSTKNPASGNRVFFQQIHGISFNNDDGSSRQAIISRCCVGEELVLIPEPNNRFDPGAVRVCRSDGEQLGYWPADGRMAHDLASGWTYHVTIAEIYTFEKDPKKHGVRLRVEVLIMSRKTEERKKRMTAKARVGQCSGSAPRSKGRQC